MQISKRTQFILSITLIFVVFSSFIKLHHQAGQSQTAPNSSVSTSDVYIEQVNREIIVGQYGISIVQDELEIFNNGTVPMNYFYYTINDYYLPYFLGLSAETVNHATLGHQEARNTLFNHKTFIVYFQKPLLPGLSRKVVTFAYYSGLQTALDNVSDQVVFFNFSIVPFSPYLIYAVSTQVNFAYRTFFESYTGNPLESGTNLLYTRSNVVPYSEEIINAQGKNNQYSSMQFTSINRRIFINPWGPIRVIEDHDLINTGGLLTNLIEYAVPESAYNFSIYDTMGTIDGGKLDTSTGLFKITLNNRAGINPGATKKYTIEYYLPLEEFFSRSYLTSALKLNLNVLDYNILTEEHHTYIHLYAGKYIKSTSITPDSMTYDKNAMVLYFYHENMYGITDYPLYLEYKQSGFQMVARGFLISAILAVILSGYAILRTRTKSRSEDEYEYREEVIPESEMREFISNYEEITAVRIDIKKLETDLSRKKIAKKAYSKQLKVLEAKMKTTQEDIKPFKKIILDARGPIAEIVKRLDLREAELISNQDGIKSYDERYKKGKLPSKQAYRTLRNQMVDNGEKIQKQIDRLINQMKAYLI